MSTAVLDAATRRVPNVRGAVKRARRNRVRSAVDTGKPDLLRGHFRRPWKTTPITAGRAATTVARFTGSIPFGEHFLFGGPEGVRLGAVDEVTVARAVGTSNAQQRRPDWLVTLMVMLDGWSSYVERAHPEMPPASRMIQGWVNELVGVDTSADQRLCAELDGDHHWWCQNTARRRALVVGLTGRRALVRTPDTAHWELRDVICRRCGELVLFPRKGWESPYCSRVCALGRVSDGLVRQWLAVLTREWEERIGHAREAVRAKGVETWQERCARTARTRHGLYDIRFECCDVMALHGLDFAATQRRLAQEDGSETNVVVLIDGTEFRQTAFEPWTAVRPGVPRV